MLTTLILLITTYLIIKYLLKPYYLFRFYKKQGGEGEFYLGNYYNKKFLKDAISKGDFMSTFKQTLKQNPDCKFLVYNYATTPILYITHPTYLKSFLRNIDNYTKAFDLLDPQEKGRGMFLQEGKPWKKSRKLFSENFHFEYLKTVIPSIIETANNNFDNIKGNKQCVPVLELFSSITGEVAGSFFFGKEFSKHKINGMSISQFTVHMIEEGGKTNYDFATAIFGSRIRTLGIFENHRKFYEMKKAEEAELYEILRELRRNPPNVKNIFSLMEDLKGTPEQYTDPEIITEFRTFYGAGTDTTSHLLSVGTYYLWKYPESEIKILNEAKRELSDLNNISIESLNRMEYTTAFVKECLRLSPPAGQLVIREAIRDHLIEDLKVKKGTYLSMPIPAIHTNPKYYSEAERFVPERYMNNGMFQDDGWKNEPFIFQAFSSGPRNCIGQNLAMIEGRLILGLFVMRFRVEYPEDYRLRMTNGFLYDTVDPLMPMVIAR